MLKKIYNDTKKIAKALFTWFYDNPDLRAAGWVVGFPHPQWGLLEQPGKFLDLSATPVKPQGPPPMRGQHTDEILADEKITTGSDGTVTWSLGDNLGTIRDLVQYNAATGTMKKPPANPSNASRTKDSWSATCGSESKRDAFWSCSRAQAGC